MHWYQKKGIEVPQTQQGDIGAKDIPSWRRICKVLLNNDYWCRALSFSPTKAKNYQRYNERIKGKRQEWGILCNLSLIHIYLVGSAHFLLPAMPLAEYQKGKGLYHLKAKAVL